MKGKYINTVIIMAAKSGKKKAGDMEKETLSLLNNHRIIWSKSELANKATLRSSQSMLIN